MMKNKLVLTEKILWLLENFRNALSLLTLIVGRTVVVRREDGQLDTNSVHIGWKSCGLTEQEYRTAKKKLVELRFIDIIATNRTQELESDNIYSDDNLERQHNIYDSKQHKIYDPNFPRKSKLGNSKKTSTTLVKLIDLTIFELGLETQVSEHKNGRSTTSSTTCNSIENTSLITSREEFDGLEQNKETTSSTTLNQKNCTKSPQSTTSSTTSPTTSENLKKDIEDTSKNRNSEHKKVKSTTLSTTPTTILSTTSLDKKSSERYNSLARAGEISSSVEKKEASKKKEIRPLATRSPPFKPKILVEEDVEILREWCLQNDIEILEKSLASWLRKYEPEYIISHLMLMNQRRVQDPEKWMESALRNNYLGEKQRILSNRKFATELQFKYGWSSLKVSQKFCADSDTKKDFDFSLAEDVFQELLMNELKNRMSISENE